MCGAHSETNFSRGLAKVKAKRLDFLPTIKAYIDSWMCW